MSPSEIDTVRALLKSKPRPVGWLERRKRLDEVGSVWPVADDVQLTSVDANGVPAEYSIVPGSDRFSFAHVFSWRWLLLRFNPEPSPLGD